MNVNEKPRFYFLSSPIFHKIFLFSVSLLFFYFFYLMLEITWQYRHLENDVAFLRIKQDVTSYPYYLPSFFIHALTSIFCLAVGFPQFFLVLQRRKKLHRTLGIIYIVGIVILSGPSGLILGLHANGGVSSQLGFVLLAILWIFFTVRSAWRIRKKNILGHKHDMIRSYALTLSAITLRAWKFILVLAFEPAPMDVYRIVAWLGWVLNLAVCEFYFYLNSRKSL